MNNKNNSFSWLRLMCVAVVALFSMNTMAQKDEKIFDIVEQMPQFPSGDVELMQYIAKNIKYPQKASEKGVQGRVLVRFIVEIDGSLTNAEVVATSAGIGQATPVEVVAKMTEKERQDAEAHNAGVKALHDEAIRVVKSMPKWTPGKQRGKEVRCKYTIPVTYRLN